VGVDSGDADQPAAIAAAVDEHRLADGTLVCHGHEAPDAEADRYVIGHDHPAIRIEGKRRPCYLYGEGAYRGGDVLALPAFNPLATGTLVNRLDRHDPASPLLADVRAFRPVVWDEAAEETYVFPPLGSSGAFL
jgi:metallophosphoesterase superfamily enzyme